MKQIYSVRKTCREENDMLPEVAILNDKTLDLVEAVDLANQEVRRTIEEYEVNDLYWQSTQYKDKTREVHRQSKNWFSVAGSIRDNGKYHTDIEVFLDVTMEELTDLIVEDALEQGLEGGAVREFIEQFYTEPKYFDALVQLCEIVAPDVLKYKDNCVDCGDRFDVFEIDTTRLTAIYSEGIDFRCPNCTQAHEEQEQEENERF